MDISSTFIVLLSSLILTGFVAGQNPELRAKVDVPPRDTVVEAGKSAMLTCETTIEDHETNNLEWNEYITSTTGTSIFDSVTPEDISDPNKYAIHGEYDLEVKNTKYEDGGLYSCALTLGADSTNDADLVVVEPPEITIPDLVENDTITAMCSTRYGARAPEDLADNVLPKMRVMLDHNVLEVQSELTPGEPGPEGEYRPSELKMVTNGTARWKDNGKNLTCEVYTDDSEHPFKLIASKILDVRFPVRNIRVHPDETEYEYGTIIQCLADGNPAPEYDWRAISSSVSPGGVVNKGNLTVVQEMMGEEQVWECTASNNVYNIETTSITINFSAIEPKDPSGGGSGADHVTSTVITLLALLLLTYILH